MVLLQDINHHKFHEIWSSEYKTYINVWTKEVECLMYFHKIYIPASPPQFALQLETTKTWDKLGNFSSQSWELQFAVDSSKRKEETLNVPWFVIMKYIETPCRSIRRYEKAGNAMNKWKLEDKISLTVFLKKANLRLDFGEITFEHVMKLYSRVCK